MEYPWISANFPRFSPCLFLQKRGLPAGWDCRHGPEYCHGRGDSEGAFVRSFRVPRSARRSALKAVDLGRKRPRNGNETIAICAMYGIFTNICPYMEHMGYRWSTSRLSTRSSRSSWPRMLGGTPMGRLWWKLPYESGYTTVCDSLFGFIGVHWGLLWLMLIFMYFLLDGGFHSHAGTPLSLVGLEKKENPSMDENWGTPILENLHFKGGLIHRDTKRSQAEHVSALHLGADTINYKLRNYQATIWSWETMWLYSTNIVGHM